MQLMQRFGSDYSDKEYIDRCFNAIISHPGSCDNVWLATPYGFPKIEKHREVAKILEGTIKKFRDAGISVSLQLSNSIGHGEYMSSRDCTGLIYDGAETEHMVGPDGTVAGYCFCPNGKHFREYLLEEIAIYSELKPDCIWVDDDFRATNHAPVSFGCFCDDCVSKFNKKHGTSFDRKGLVNEVLHGSLDIREKFITGLRANFYELMSLIGKTVREISPDTVLGMQYGPHGAYAGHGSEFVIDAMRDSTGHVPNTRPGGGSYDDTVPNDFIWKGWLLSYQNAILPDYVTCKCPEIENLPFVAYGKTPAGTAFETAHYFAMGNTDMSYSMFMSTNEPMSFYEKTLSLFAENREYWDKLSEVNKKTVASGMSYVLGTKAWKKDVAENESFEKLSEECFFGAYPLIYDAIPVTLEHRDERVRLLHPEVAGYLDSDEIEKLLSQNVITDGECVKILEKRGFDIGVKAEKIEESVVLKLYEDLTDHPINSKGFTQWKSSFFTPGRKTCMALYPKNGSAEIIGTYATSVPVPPISDNKDHPFGVSSLVITTNKGGKWVIFGYTPWKGVISHAKRDQMLNAADYISGNSLAAKIVSDEKVVLNVRINGKKETAAVSVTNVTVGKLSGIKVLVRDPQSKNFSFMTYGRKTEKLPFEDTPDGTLVTLPEIDAWSVGTLFAD